MTARNALLTIVAALTVVPAVSSRADSIRVPQDQPTIAAGIGAASPGDTVLISSGTYHEHGLSVTEGITIAGAAGIADSVTIDGDANQIMRFSLADGSVVRGLTFTGGSSHMIGGAVRCDTTSVTFESCDFTSNYAGYIGGAIYIESAERSVQTFSDCAFTSNTSIGSAGAVWVEHGSVIFTGCSFEDNDADFGGGAVGTKDGTTIGFTDCSFDGNRALGGLGGALDIDDDATLTLSGCSFTENDAFDDEGGAVFVGRDAVAHIDDCDFISNWADNIGGALSFYRADEISVTDCLFEGNATSGSAAALYIPNSTNVTLERNEFIGNTGTGGAVVEIYNSPATLSDCLFAGNTSGWGGALEIWNSDPTTIHGCTFTGNEMSGVGGGPALSIYGTSGGDPTITLEYCSISENIGGEPFYTSDGFANLSCSNVWGNPAGDWVGPIAGQESVNGNLCENPLFCDAAARDYRLCADSPCLPENNPECSELIGAYEAGCPECGTAAEPASWGQIKAIFR